MSQYNDASNGNYAQTVWTCINGRYDGNETHYQWNAALVYSRTATQRNRIAAHEFGHVYGLGHVTTLCRIMRVDIGYLTDCTMTTPQSDDVAGVEAIY